MGRCVLHPLPGGSPPPVSAGPHRTNRIKRWKAAHKPGSVHRQRARGPGGGGDHLSGTAVTGGLERHWGTERERWPTLVPRAEALALLPAGVYRAGTSRCRWCALTAPLHPYLCGRRTEVHRPPSAVCFCGTVLTVARTGRYPAGLAIGEPGLSSTGRSTTVAEARQPSTDRDHLGCFPGFMLSSRRLADAAQSRRAAGGGFAGDRVGDMGL